MNREPKAGETVCWSSHSGEARGEVASKVKRRTAIKSHVVAASKDNPEFIVESAEGKRAAHTASALKPERG